jgi:hypothetical protein
VLTTSDCPYLWFNQAFDIPTWWFEQTQVTIILCKTKLIHLESLHNIPHNYQLELELDSESTSLKTNSGKIRGNESFQTIWKQRPQFCQSLDLNLDHINSWRALESIPSLYFLPHIDIQQLQDHFKIDDALMVVHLMCASSPQTIKTITQRHIQLQNLLYTRRNLLIVLQEPTELYYLNHLLWTQLPSLILFNQQNESLVTNSRLSLASYYLHYDLPNDYTSTPLLSLNQLSPQIHIIKAYDIAQAVASYSYPLHQTLAYFDFIYHVPSFETETTVYKSKPLKQTMEVDSSFVDLNQYPSLQEQKELDLMMTRHKMVTQHASPKSHLSKKEVVEKNSILWNKLDIGQEKNKVNHLDINKTSLFSHFESTSNNSELTTETVDSSMPKERALISKPSHHLDPQGVSPSLDNSNELLIMNQLEEKSIITSVASSVASSRSHSLKDSDSFIMNYDDAPGDPSLENHDEFDYIASPLLDPIDELMDDGRETEAFDSREIENLLRQPLDESLSYLHEEKISQESKLDHHSHQESVSSDFQSHISRPIHLENTTLRVATTHETNYSFHDDDQSDIIDFSLSELSNLVLSTENELSSVELNSTDSHSPILSIPSISGDPHLVGLPTLKQIPKDNLQKYDDDSSFHNESLFHNESSDSDSMNSEDSIWHQSTKPLIQKDLYLKSKQLEGGKGFLHNLAIDDNDSTQVKDIKELDSIKELDKLDKSDTTRSIEDKTIKLDLENPTAIQLLRDIPQSLPYSHHSKASIPRALPPSRSQQRQPMVKPYHQRHTISSVKKHEINTQSAHTKDEASTRVFKDDSINLEQKVTVHTRDEDKVSFMPQTTHTKSINEDDTTRLHKDSFSDLFQETDIQEQQIPMRTKMHESSQHMHDKSQQKAPHTNQAATDARQTATDARQTATDARQTATDARLRNPHEAFPNSKSKFRKSFSDVLNSLRKK